MALVIPDIEGITNGTNGYDIQAVPDYTDWAAGIGIDSGTYVVSGMAVTWSSGITFAVAAGYYCINGLQYTYAGGTIALSSGASTTDRRDIISINTSGTLITTAGTVCGTAGWIRTNTAALPPVKPAIPANNCLLGEVAVPYNIASTASAICVVDKTAIGKFGPGSGTVSGTLPTGGITSAGLTTGLQVDSTSARMVYLSYVSGGAGQTAEVYMSPDGVTYTYLGYSGTLASGAYWNLPVYVPQGWYLQHVISGSMSLNAHLV